ncbi:hypothetical protein JOB18_003387 [Solea senegalensis]|uniref:Uncharacterized protein n=1 Tax=Solea senegalensis TaxID=28829 RepID=A0AAV6QRX8_SOLSE|nr:hypothetical protein JOB18_003387 [Solea senegalensis]
MEISERDRGIMLTNERNRASERSKQRNGRMFEARKRSRRRRRRRGCLHYRDIMSQLRECGLGVRTGDSLVRTQHQHDTANRAGSTSACRQLCGVIHAPLLPIKPNYSTAQRGTRPGHGLITE